MNDWLTHDYNHESYNLTDCEREYAIKLSRDNCICWAKRKKCPCCNSKKAQRILDHDRYGLTFDILLCNFCGFVYFQYVLDDSSVDIYYNKYFLPLINYNKTTIDERGVFSQYKFIEPHLFTRLVDDKIDVLDFGGGSHQMLQIFKEHLSTIGISSSLSIYEPNSYYWKDYEDNNINKLTTYRDPTLNKCFDLILLSHVFEHLNYPSRYLQDLSLLLKDHGIIYIEVPGIYNTHNFHGFNYDFQTACPHFHAQLFNANTLVHIANRSGFQQLEATESVRALFAKDENPKCFTRKTLGINARNTLNYLNFIESHKDKFGQEDKFFYDVFGRTEPLWNKSQTTTL